MNRPRASAAVLHIQGPNVLTHKRSTAIPPTMDSGMVKRILMVMVTGYQRWISPWLPARCRFYPSCSQYALHALEKYGALRGGWMALKRLLRCGPWSKGGDDPVP